jgi:hypothetical protein
MHSPRKRSKLATKKTPEIIVEIEGQKLVAGDGFEPPTFRL